MKPGHGKKALIAMSGGVDSSVAAALLLEAGYDVVGCFMRLGSDDSVEADDGLQVPVCDSTKLKAGHQGCCSLNDAADARMVAGLLGIPFYVLNFKKDFDRVIDYFVDEYNAGRTPNPCVRCNDWLKFGKLAAYARSIEADYVATGHYARVDHTQAEARLMRGCDTFKDQSYVLFGTRQRDLNHMLLPIGDMQKTEVRAHAERRGLPVFDKPDSQEICFVPDNDYMRLIKTRVVKQRDLKQHDPKQRDVEQLDVKRRTTARVAPGPIVDQQGNVVGQHEGQQHFTIGQRRGVGVAFGYPIYVTHKDAATNTVTVGPREGLLAGGCRADQVNWLIDPPTQPRRCQVKIRYNAQPVCAEVCVAGDDAFAVTFDQPQAAVSPGQAVVCYDGDQVIGGGWIADGC